MKQQIHLRESAYVL